MNETPRRRRATKEAAETRKKIGTNNLTIRSNIATTDTVVV